MFSQHSASLLAVTPAECHSHWMRVGSLLHLLLLQTLVVRVLCVPTPPSVVTGTWACWTS